MKLVTQPVEPSDDAVIVFKKVGIVQRLQLLRQTLSSKRQKGRRGYRLRYSNGQLAIVTAPEG